MSAWDSLPYIFSAIIQNPWFQNFFSSTSSMVLGGTKARQEFFLLKLIRVCITVSLVRSLMEV